MAPGIFNPASVSALLSAVVSLIGGVGAWVLGRAPDWEDVRPLSRVGFTAAVVAACNFTATLDVHPAVYAWTGRVQVLAVALHVAAWYTYALQWGAPVPRAWRVAIFGPLVAAGVLALVPGLVYGDVIAIRSVTWLGVAYHDPELVPVGFALIGAIAVYGAGAVVRIATLKGRGLPFRRTLVAVTSTILAMGVHDAVVIGGLNAPTPYLLDFGLFGPAIVIAVLTLRRVVVGATDLRRLRTGLEVAVVDRTRALERSQAALAASERLAALGQFASGFALEVSHPVKVVSANLDALGRELRDDPRDRVRARLEDARAALARIGSVARQLLVAGRPAGAPTRPAIDVRVGRAADAALAAGRAKGVAGVTLEAAVAPGLTVAAQEEEVVEVLTTLVLHAVGEAAGGRIRTVRVRADAEGDRVQIAVEDDGPGLTEEALLHAFEPFHETEQVRGSGLALAVARGLVEGMGGTLRLKSAPGRGTRAVLDLPRGAPDASAADLPAAFVAVPLRARVLIVDGDPRELRAIVEIVSADHEVEGVGGVREALAALADRSFDLVLCDATLPGGGAERFWEELLLSAPAMQKRAAFLAGGAETPAALAFLARQPQPVLRKPIGLEEVRAVMDRLGIGAPNPRAAAVRVRGAEHVVGKLRRE